MNRQTEDLIIQLAMQRGMISPEKLAEVTVSSGGSSDSEPVKGGEDSTLTRLIRQGLISPWDIRALEKDLASAGHQGASPNDVFPTSHTAHVQGSTSEQDAAQTRGLGVGGSRLSLTTLSGWGRYQVLSLLGRGGMGEVYKAFDPRLRRSVALKFLYRDDPEMGVRFIKEAQAQARVEHEFICRVYEVGEHLDHPYIAMQLIQGDNLSEAKKNLTLEEKVRIVMQVASALHVAHKQGLIHRDLKPSNIMVEKLEDGKHRPYIMDFGLARELSTSGLTMTGEVLGTPAFMSPEQARGHSENLDRRTDIYALGATLYDLVSGRPPFCCKSTLETLMQILNQEPSPLRQLVPDVSPDLDTIVMKCLEKEPSRRYDSSLALAQDLERYLEGEPIQARPSTWRYRLVKRAKKNPLVTALAASVVVVALAAAGFALRERSLANERMRLAGEFNQQVSSIEQAMRFAYLAPLHDVRREKEAAKQRLSELSLRIQNEGRAGKGPGEFALGVGYLAVQDYEIARKNLENAWQAGYRNPEVAAALGRAYGELYKKELENAEKIGNAKMRDRIKQEAEKSLREPALFYFAKAEERRAGWADYQAALIASLEKKWNMALSLTRKAQAELSWLYEARRLEGDVFAELAHERSAAGQDDDALSQLKNAISTYEYARDIARSDESIILREADGWSRWMSIEIIRGGDPTPAYEKAISACDKAFIANPESSAAASMKSSILWRWSEFESGRGSNPEKVISQAVAMAEQAIRFDPNEEKAHLQLGYSYWKKAEYEKGKGLDAADSLNHAITAYDKALQTNPNSFSGHGGMGLTLWTLGEDEAAKNLDARPHLTAAIDHFTTCYRLDPKEANSMSNASGVYRKLAYVDWGKNLDPTPLLDKSIDSAKKATEINPKMIQAFINMATASLDKGMYAVQKLKDPSVAYDTAINAFKKAVELNPKNALTFTNLAYAYRSKAQYALTAGRDPMGNISDSLAAAHRAIDINPAYSGAYRALAAAERLRGEVLLEMGQEPTEALIQAVKAAQKAIEVGGERLDALEYWAESEIITARFLLSRRQSPEKALNAAAACLKRGEVIDLENAYLHLNRAELNYRLVEWQLIQGVDPRRTINAGIAAAEKALAIDTDTRQAKALKGVFVSLQAHIETDPGRRATLARDAVATLTPVLSQERHFNTLYGERLREAERIAQGNAVTTQNK